MDRPVTLQSYKGRSIALGQTVKVYLNWHKGNLFSIVDMNTGLVAAYCGKVLLGDAVFHVSTAGRVRVLREHQKNVHAWVKGTLLGLDTTKPDSLGREILYDPYRTPAFTDVQNGTSVYEAPLVQLEARRAWIA